jgi:hypothetical protein
MLGLIDGMTGMESASRREMRGYLEEFFRAIAPGSIKKSLVDGCKPQSTM